ncbi:hypothetical protein OIU76_023416 [Salix suchowensis]|nr:hypothetical protein OIU76_023416 [Salix suchowensis]
MTFPKALIQQSVEHAKKKNRKRRRDKTGRIKTEIDSPESNAARKETLPTKTKIDSLESNAARKETVPTTTEIDSLESNAARKETVPTKMEIDDIESNAARKLQQEYQSTLGDPIADFERLLHSAAPFIISSWTNKNQQLDGSLHQTQLPKISIQDVWKWYEAPGNYGLEVEAEILQILMNKADTDPELIFEFFESEPPHERKPLHLKIRDLINISTSNVQVFGDPSKLESMNLDDLHPSSWFAVAWYPIYRIPQGKFQAAFLTYHSFNQYIVYSIPIDSLSKTFQMIVFPVIGLQSYRTENECWFDLRAPVESSSEETTSSTTSEILIERSRAQEERCRTLNRNSMVLSTRSVTKDQVSRVNYHRDYEFFINARKKPVKMTFPKALIQQSVEHAKKKNRKRRRDKTGRIKTEIDSPESNAARKETLPTTTEIDSLESNAARKETVPTTTEIDSLESNAARKETVPTKMEIDSLESNAARKETVPTTAEIDSLESNAARKETVPTTMEIDYLESNAARKLVPTTTEIDSLESNAARKETVPTKMEIDYLESNAARKLEQEYQSKLGDPKADFERLLHSAAPFIISSWTNKNQQLDGSLHQTQLPKISIQDVWKWYEAPGNYGLEVKARDSPNPNGFPAKSTPFSAYFVPYLSAVQFFGYPQLSYVCGKNKADTDPELIFEFFESEPPHERKPLHLKIRDLINISTSNVQVFGDPSKLESMNLDDLHPSSWFAVAWYPIYRIPQGKFQAAFLTYHSFNQYIVYSIPIDSLSKTFQMIVFPVIGLQSYRTENECWFDLRAPVESSSEETTSSTTSEILIERSRAPEERCRTLNRNSMVLSTRSVTKDQVSRVNYHRDYEFFINARLIFPASHLKLY